MTDHAALDAEIVRLRNLVAHLIEREAAIEAIHDGCCGIVDLTVTAALREEA